MLCCCQVELLIKNITIRNLVDELPPSIRVYIKRKADVPNGNILFFVFAPVQTGIWYQAVTSRTLLLSVKLAGRNKRKRIWYKILVSPVCYFVTTFSLSGSLPVFIINISFVSIFLSLILCPRSHLAFSLIPMLQFSISQSAECLSGYRIKFKVFLIHREVLHGFDLLFLSKLVQLQISVCDLCLTGVSLLEFSKYWLHKAREVQEDTKTHTSGEWLPR